VPNNSCAILLGILIRDLAGVLHGDGNNLNLGNPIDLVATLVKVSGALPPTAAAFLRRFAY